MKKIIKFLKIFLGLILSLVLIAVLYINLHPTFVGSSNAESMAKIKQSANFDGEHFQNLVKTQASTIRVEGDKADKWKLLKNFIFPPKGKNFV